MPLNTPDIKELQAIVDWVNLTEDVREISIKLDGVELFISRDRQQAGGQSPAAHVPAPFPLSMSSTPAATAPAVAADEPVRADALAPDEVLIKAPMVGTYYASPKPGAPHFAAIGDAVSADTVLCIVEVMKLMNNIEAQVEGTVTRILAADNQAVEYGQPLFVIKRAA